MSKEEMTEIVGDVLEQTDGLDIDVQAGLIVSAILGED